MSMQDTAEMPIPVGTDAEPRREDAEAMADQSASVTYVPSWEEVARQHGRTIYNFAYRLSGDPDDANDLTQEVLLRVRRGLATYKPITFKGWLWRITRNAFLDEVRRRNRRQTYPLPEGFERMFGPTAPPPDEVLAASGLSQDVQGALLKLPYDFRESVVLSDVVGLSYREIADAVGVPVGTIRSRIHRGRKALRQELADTA